MGSRMPPKKQPTNGSRLKHDAFVEACTQALERLDLAELVQNPPEITEFMHAYVVARCLPLVMMRRPKTEDWRMEERFDDQIARVTELGENFLNSWKPQDNIQAALMLDATLGITNPTNAFIEYLMQ